MWWFLGAVFALTVIVILAIVIKANSIPSAPRARSVSYQVGYDDVGKSWIVTSPGGQNCEQNFQDELFFADDPILHPGPVPTSKDDYMQGCYDAIRDWK